MSELKSSTSSGEIGVVPRTGGRGGVWIRLGGALELATLRRAFLTLIEHDGWSEPSGIDLRGVTSNAVDRRALAGLASFVRPLVRYHEARGRTSILVSGEADAALAEYYISLQPDAEQSQMRVFQSWNSADAWLDS